MKKEFALKIFEGFSIERWNDMIRPFDLVQMDKDAERLFVAYIIGKYEEQNGVKIDWEWMMYASLFELLRKIALCDIKSPVQRLIREEYPAEYEEHVNTLKLLTLNTFNKISFKLFLQIKGLKINIIL